MSVVEAVTPRKANLIRKHVGELYDYLDADRPVSKYDRPHSMDNSAWKQLLRSEIIVQVDTELPHEEASETNRRGLYDIPPHIRRYIRQTYADPRDDTLCPEPDCVGNGFSNTKRGFECVRCGTPLSRQRVESHYGGGDE